MHGIIGNILQTHEFDGSLTVKYDEIDDIFIDVLLEKFSMYQTVLFSSPIDAIFGRDMLVDIPYLVDWNKISGDRNQAQLLIMVQCIVMKRQGLDYKVETKIF